MDSTELAISYIDEKNLWANFKPLIQSLFPLKEIEINLDNTKTLTKNLKLGFYNSNDDFFKTSESPVYYYRKPLMNILLISCDSKAAYSETIKAKCQEFISTYENNSEWLLIYTSENQISSMEEYVINFLSEIIN